MSNYFSGSQVFWNLRSQINKTTCRLLTFDKRNLKSKTHDRFSSQASTKHLKILSPPPPHQHQCKILPKPFKTEIIETNWLKQCSVIFKFSFAVKLCASEARTWKKDWHEGADNILKSGVLLYEYFYTTPSCQENIMLLLEVCFTALNGKKFLFFPLSIN